MYRMFSIIVAVFIFMFTATSAKAEYDYGADAIQQALPDEATEILDNAQITPENSGATGLSFSGVLDWLWEQLCGKIQKPLRLLVTLLGVVILCAFVDSLQPMEGSSVNSAFSVVGVLSAAVITVSAIHEVLSAVQDILSIAANFMLVFIPIFAGLVAVMGHVTTAGAVNAVALSATQLFSQLAVNYLAPLSGAVMGLSVVGSVEPRLDLSRLGELIKKFVMWALTLLMTIFMSILSAQTFVANASDNALMRTAKFMVSSGVPVVGGAISDAVYTVTGGLELLKNSVGTYGMIAAAVIIIPVLTTLVCYRAALFCAECVGEMFGLKPLSSLFKTCGAVMSIMLAVTASFLLLNTIAVLILLAFSSGSA